MAEKRRDNRGIVLEKGESQEKTGRYRYRYYDDRGVSHDVYSWRLRPEDAAPEGKKYGESLRELEAQIQKDMIENIKAWGTGSLSVNRVWQRNIYNSINRTGSRQPITILKVCIGYISRTKSEKEKSIR